MATRGETAEIAALTTEMREYQRRQDERDQRIHQRFDKLDQNVDCLERRTRALENISRFQGGAQRALIWALGFVVTLAGLVIGALKVFK